MYSEFQDGGRGPSLVAESVHGLILCRERSQQRSWLHRLFGKFKPVHLSMHRLGILSLSCDSQYLEQHISVQTDLSHQQTPSTCLFLHRDQDSRQLAIVPGARLGNFPSVASRIRPDSIGWPLTMTLRPLSRTSLVTGMSCQIASERKTTPHR